MKKNCKYFFSKNNGTTNHAGSKARNDAEEIMSMCGYSRIHTASSMPYKVIRKLVEYSMYPFICKIDKGSIVVNQYPNLPLWFNICLKINKKKRDYKVITLVHDMAIRAKGTRINNKFLQKFVIDFSDIIIVHNSKMKKYMCDEFGINENKIIELTIFDYLLDFNPKSLCDKKINSIIIAGNLDKNKCGYIYKLKKSLLKFNLYGPNYIENEKKENINYFGSFTPEELPLNLDGAWGLIWDGPSTETCEDLIGKYLRVNNPHKTSLYLACGIPIIIWKEAALADFIEKNNLGIVVDTLDDLERIIGQISMEDYNLMKQNAIIFGEKIRKGHYLSVAIEKAENLLR